MAERGAAGALLPAGEAVCRTLREQGVTSVFGLLGGSMLELYDAMYRHGEIRYVGARDERAAGHMADAWARVTGGPGIVLGAQAGPGVANLVSAVAEAALAYSPLVVLAGAVSRSDHGKDTFQEIDQVGLFAPICKRSIAVGDPRRLTGMLRDAIRLALSGRRGPVVLHVPRDLFAAEVPAPDPGPVLPARAGPPSRAQLRAVRAAIREARAPVIVAGGGLKWSGGGEALRTLAEALRIPVVASTGHADLMPHGHPLFASQGGPRGNRVASRLGAEADLLLVLGARLGFNSTFLSHEYVSPTAKIVQVDIEGSAIGRYFPVHLGIQADARETALALAAELGGHERDDTRRREWRRRFEADWRGLLAEREAEARDDSTPMAPVRALAEIRRALPEDAIVTLDTGNTCLQAADRLAHRRCPGLIAPLDFGLVGFGYAAALGAQAAAPGRRVVAVIGDGGFGYTVSEITTAVQHDLPVVAVVLDNGAWGAEKAYQRQYFGGRLLGAELLNPPYDEIARLCGALGYRADTPAALAGALAEALAAKRPAVIHAKIDPEAIIALRKDLFASSGGNVASGGNAASGAGGCGRPGRCGERTRAEAVSPPERVDVLVAGAGNAALCAALAAREQGARVVVLERAPPHEDGGNSRFTAGAFRCVYDGVDDLRRLMPDLRDEEIARTDFGAYPEERFFDDMGRVTQYRCDPDLVEILVRQSRDTLRWLRARGVRFQPLWGRQAFAVDGRFRFWGGLCVEAWGGGPQLVETLQRAAREAGIEIRHHARALSLLHGDGGVTGLRVKRQGRTRALHARAVVLATGGFEANHEWRARYLGPGWDLARVRGTRYNTGDGLRMALDAGAAPFGHWSGCHAVGWDRNAPEFGDLAVGDAFQKHSYPFGIMLNAKGERFVDEGADFRNYTYARYGGEILRQPGHFAWQIFDHRVAHLLRDEYRIRQVTRVRAGTLEELVRRLEDVDPEAALATIREFNRAVRTELPFDPNVRDGRGTRGLPLPKSHWANPLDTPPFEAYAVTCGVTFTFGGLRIDTTGRVLDGDLAPIPGLYAAGELVGGLFYCNYPGGAGLTSGAVFGRLAGRSAAARTACRREARGG